MNTTVYGRQLGYWEDDVTTEYWSEAAAQAAHINGSIYEIQYGSVRKPVWYIMMLEELVSVSHFDEYGNAPLEYTFEKLKDGTLFRNETTIREFGQGFEKVLKVTQNFYDRRKKLCTVIHLGKGGFEKSRKVVGKSAASIRHVISIGD